MEYDLFNDPGKWETTLVDKRIWQNKDSHTRLHHQCQSLQQYLLFDIFTPQVIVGGVNLLEKHAEQQRLLEESAKELEARHQRETDLKRKLEEQEAEKIDIEEKYASLKDEASGKTKKLKKVCLTVLLTDLEVSGFLDPPAPFLCLSVLLSATQNFHTSHHRIS